MSRQCYPRSLPFCDSYYSSPSACVHKHKTAGTQSHAAPSDCAFPPSDTPVSSHSIRCPFSSMLSHPCLTRPRQRTSPRDPNADNTLVSPVPSSHFQTRSRKSLPTKPSGAGRTWQRGIPSPRGFHLSVNLTSHHRPPTRKSKCRYQWGTTRSPSRA